MQYEEGTEGSAAIKHKFANAKPEYFCGKWL